MLVHWQLSSTIALPPPENPTTVYAAEHSTISLIQLRSGLYKNLDLKSNPLYVGFSAFPCSFANSACVVVIVMQNSVAVSYPNRTIVESFNASCLKDNSLTLSYICRTGDIVHTICSGSSTYTVLKNCPPAFSKPSCISLVDKSASIGYSSCTVLNHTATNTTCKCTLNKFSISHNRRRLDASSANSSSSFSLNVGTMLAFVASGAESTVLSAQGLNASEISKEWMVLATMGTLIVVMAALMFLGHSYDATKINDIKQFSKKRIVIVL